MSEHDERVIDVWGYVKKLWVYKWVWLAVFALVAVAGGAYAMTRPPAYTATQSVIITIPPVTSEAEATQQMAALTSISDVYKRLAVRPPVADIVMSKHPEVSSVQSLQDRVTVTGGGLMIDIETTSQNEKQGAALVRDIAIAMHDQVPAAVSANPPHLQAGLTPVGEPVIVQVNSGRTMLLAASLLGGLVLATAVAGLLAARRR